MVERREVGFSTWHGSEGRAAQPTVGRVTDHPPAPAVPRGWCTDDRGRRTDITAPKRYTLLLCLIQRAQIQARDDLAEMFLKRIARFHVQAQQELELIRARHRALTEELIDTLADML